jgi:hypothetical protein
VEQQLKLYISQAFDLVKLSVGGKLVFKFSGIDYEDASLERLIGTFRKLTNNDELVKDLSRFKDERNFLSHRAVTFCLDPDDELDHSALATIKDRLPAIVEEAKRLRVAINEESHHFLNQLLFGDFDD